MTANPIDGKNFFSFSDYLLERTKCVEESLEKFLPSKGKGHPVLRDAMRYCLIGAGKYFRPILAIASCEASGGEWREIMAPACAIEFIHAYSLAHDDLPAMDDAAARRGKPSCHRQYGHAMAILAGDALLTEAWGLIADWGKRSPDRAEASIKIIAELANGAGLAGMVSGQAYDIDENGAADVDALDDLHRLKTGALIKASVRIGAIAARADEATLEKLSAYAAAVGLAFQVIDDVLDVEGVNTGKDHGADAAKGKRSYPTLVGIEASKRKAQGLIVEAVAALDGLPGPTEPLAAIARYAIERDK